MEDFVKLLKGAATAERGKIRDTKFEHRKKVRQQTTIK
jgi:hypothetical protein